MTVKNSDLLWWRMFKHAAPTLLGGVAGEADVDPGDREAAPADDAEEEVGLMSEPAVVHRKREPFDVLIDRTTPWGNHFRIGRDGTRAEVIE